MNKPELLRVEVAYIALDRQFLREIHLPPGSTVADALVASKVEEEFAIKLDALRVGIWSKAVDRSAMLADGDRVEIYRPLKIDPKDARRARAKQKG